jgi:DNA-binding MarR family transcriptional regulator
MDNTSELKEQINVALLHLMMEFVRLDRMTQQYGTDTPIHHAEIHALASIVENPGVHIGGLAEKLGGAKASASELVKKLERKGLVRKETNADNLSKLSLFPTDKGEKAQETHARYHATLNNSVFEELSGATETELDFLSEFLVSLTKKLGDWRSADG